MTEAATELREYRIAYWRINHNRHPLSNLPVMDKTKYSEEMYTEVGVEVACRLYRDLCPGMMFIPWHEPTPHP